MVTLLLALSAFAEEPALGLPAEEAQDVQEASPAEGTEAAEETTANKTEAAVLPPVEPPEVHVPSKPRNMFKFQVGYDTLFAGEDPFTGPSIEPSWTFEQDHFAIDVAPLTVAFDVGGQSAGGFRFEVLDTRAYYVISPTAKHSFYVGGGFGIGIALFGAEDELRHGWGFDFIAAGGVHLFRNKPVRMVIDADLTLPAWKQHRYDVSSDKELTSRAWSPVIGLRVGFSYQTAVTILDVLDSIF